MMGLDGWPCLLWHMRVSYCGTILFWFILPPGALLLATLWRSYSKSGLIHGLQGSTLVILGHSLVTEKSQCETVRILSRLFPGSLGCGSGTLTTLPPPQHYSVCLQNKEYEVSAVLPTLGPPPQLH